MCLVVREATREQEADQGVGVQIQCWKTGLNWKLFSLTLFDRPLDIQNAGDRSDRLFVVEQKGVIYVISPEGQSAVFLDIQDQVEFDESERGLLGLAFHPDFELNGYFYVNYTSLNPDRSVISRFSISEGDPTSQTQGASLYYLKYLSRISGTMAANSHSTVLTAICISPWATGAL